MTTGKYILGTIYIIWTVFAIKAFIVYRNHGHIESNILPLTFASLWAIAHFALLVTYGIQTW